jgi:hypothetical protein
MKVIALLSWYEENPAWLAECVSSLGKLCDHVIAVDGPYGLVPGSTAKPGSSPTQSDTIRRVCAGLNIGCTIHTPNQVWWEGEVAKRDFMFRLGMTIATPGDDWFLRIDADESFTEIPPDTKTQLFNTDCDVAEITIWERHPELGDSQSAFRCLFRALPGIAIQQAHYVVTVPDHTQLKVAGGAGVRVLNGDTNVHQLDPALQLMDMKLEHKSHLRLPERQWLKTRYQNDLVRLELENTKEF